jgi:hypothetical protein
MEMQRWEEKRREEKSRAEQSREEKSRAEKRREEKSREERRGEERRERESCGGKEKLAPCLACASMKKHANAARTNSFSTVQFKHKATQRLSLLARASRQG